LNSDSPLTTTVSGLSACLRHDVFIETHKLVQMMETKMKDLLRRNLLILMLGVSSATFASPFAFDVSAMASDNDSGGDSDSDSGGDSDGDSDSDSDSDSSHHSSHDSGHDSGDDDSSHHSSDDSNDDEDDRRLRGKKRKS
jgi:hypothetical protein